MLSFKNGYVYRVIASMVMIILKLDYGTGFFINISKGENHKVLRSYRNMFLDKEWYFKYFEWKLYKKRLFCRKHL